MADHTLPWRAFEILSQWRAFSLRLCSRVGVTCMNPRGGGGGAGGGAGGAPRDPEGGGGWEVEDAEEEAAGLSEEAGGSRLEAASAAGGGAGGRMADWAVWGVGGGRLGRRLLCGVAGEAPAPTAAADPTADPAVTAVASGDAASIACSCCPIWPGVGRCGVASKLSPCCACCAVALPGRCVQPHAPSQDAGTQG